jgi:hypothetical protein
MYGQGQRNAVKDHAVAARAVTRIHHGLQSGLNADPGLTHKSEAASLDRLQHDPDSADRRFDPGTPHPLKNGSHLAGLRLWTSVAPGAMHTHDELPWRGELG